MTTAPIVGSHFRPPAKAILQVLPLGHPLQLKPEPENQYDPQAVAIWVASATLQEFEDELSLTLPGYGYAFEELPQAIHLGYMDAKYGHAAKWHDAIASAIASAAKAAVFDGHTPDDYWSGSLSFDPAGKYLVQFEL